MNGGAPVLIRHYTDPTCPFAFSAERQRLRLLWLYGEQIEWELHMVVLQEERPGDAFPPERISASRRELQLRYGMPIDWQPVEASSSLPACRAVVATRLRAPDREAAFLRRLRVLHMVVLQEERPGDAFPPERISASRRELQLRYGMPIDWQPVEASSSLPACRAVVATRLRAPDREAAFLRRLRVLHFSALDLDDPAVIERAATEALIEPEEMRVWLERPDVEPELEADMTAARSPSPASRAQDYKLGGPPDERRYTCPSYELIRVTEPPADWPTANRVDLPGFRPVEAYEAAIANLAPELTRRPDPESVEDVLTWAGMPIATAEVAAVCDREIADVRAELARIATFLPVGGDGYWTAAPLL